MFAISPNPFHRRAPQPIPGCGPALPGSAWSGPDHLIRRIGHRTIGHRTIGHWAIWLWLLLPGAAATQAGDWPQILGPHRNGVAEDEPTLSAWTASGPQVHWSAALGLGYAGPVVVKGQVIVFHRVDELDRVDCYRAADGSPRWQTDFPATYRGGVNPDNGPRCVPLVHGDRVYLFGAAGRLHCVSLDDGKLIWSRDVYREFGGDEGYFGAGSTPIVAAEKLIINVGGRNSGLVAFDLASGTPSWRTSSEKASYSSPTLAQFGGQPCVIFVTRMSTIGVNPNNGEVQFQFPFGKRGPTVNAATPLICDGRLFVSAAYGVGARFADLSGSQPRVLWENDEVMSSQYSTCVYHRGHLYGTHGREDFGNGELRCVATRDGSVRWKVPGSGVGHVILAQDRMLLLNHAGLLRLARAVPDEYHELSRAQVSAASTRAIPALSNGRLFFRDNSGQSGKLYCVQVAQPAG